MKGEDLIATAIGEIVGAGALAGAATLVWRDGEVVQNTCVGWRDVEARLPPERDDLFRIASMTKPITSTAALMRRIRAELSNVRGTRRLAPLRYIG